MQEGLIKDTYELIIKEIQTILSIGYLLIVAIGMLFNYQKYAEFGINIFEYADIFDFLIAPFEDYRIILFTIISTIIPITLIRFDLYWSRKFPNFYSKVTFGMGKKPWHKNFRLASFAITIVFYVFLSADQYGSRTKKRIISQDNITLKFTDNEQINGKVIGKTKEVIFLLQGEQVKAIPITSTVKEIEIK